MCFSLRVAFRLNFPCGIVHQMFFGCSCGIWLRFVIFLGFGISLFRMGLIVCFFLEGSWKRWRMARFVSFETLGLFENRSNLPKGFFGFRSHCLCRLLKDSRCLRFGFMISGLILLSLFTLLIVSLLIFLILIFMLILVSDLILGKN